MKDAYLKRIFQAYYRAHIRDIPLPSSLPQREFAYLFWNRPGMIRHLSYIDSSTFLRDLLLNSPRHAYHSATYYNKPGADKMDYKGYIGCDLVFDIDSDHIPTPCHETHDYSICKECGAQIPGDKPEKCPKCGAKKFRKIVWICDECLEVSKKQVFNLIDNFLLDEIGISEDQIHIFFSGHRGYHVHVEAEAYRYLGQEERRELVDYITGQGFSYKVWNFQNQRGVMHGFSINQNGWPGKIAREFYYILNGGEEVVRSVFKDKINPTIINLLVANRSILRQRLQNGNDDWTVKKIGMPTWEKIFNILRDRIKADIDIVVSIDIHRLIRLAGSLHGKTGFIVKALDFENLKEFDPLNDAWAFPNSNSNEITITTTVPFVPPIRIGDETYGPYSEGEVVKLPLTAALFLLCKDVADLITNN